MSYKHLDKILPRDIFLALERAAPSGSVQGITVFVHYPTKGMLKAEKRGLIKVYAEHSLGGKAYQRTTEGQKLYEEYERVRRHWLK